MTNTWKKYLFGALVIACIAATALLFLPEQQADDPATHDSDVSAPPAVPIAPTAPTDAPETAVSEKATGTDWNTYHGDNALRGVTQWPLPDEMVVRWHLMTGAPVRVPPVAHDGIIFAATTRGEIIAADLEGREIWRRELTAPAPGHELPQPVYIDAPITAVNGKVFLGTDLGDVFALRADTGEELWRANIGGPVRGAPNYNSAGNRIFVIEQDLGALVCLDVDSGAEVWRSDGVDRSDGSPAIVEDVAVFGSCASALHVVAIATGERLRDIPIANGGGQVAGGVALVDGFAYAGVRDGRIMRGDVAEGAFTWITGISEDEVFATPAVHDAWVVATSYDGRVHALHRETGEIQWQHDLQGKPSSPIIADDRIIVAADGALFLLRLEDGKRVWEQRLSDEITGPAILPDMVVVGSEDGVITALGPPD